ncbi:MAG: hypothetical protein L6Q57_00010 [Alphaproteobacteria bacterium]|nr:hypothetical protein [Alphaproteobacteria bacterium]
MNKPDPTKPRSRGGRTLKVAVASLVVAAGGLVTAFSYARDPAKADAGDQKTNYRLSSGKPLMGPGIQDVRVTIGVDPLTGQSTGFNVFPEMGANYVPAIVEILGPNGPAPHCEIVRVIYSQNMITRQYEIERVELTSFSTQLDWHEHVLAASPFSNPAEAVRQVVPRGYANDDAGQADYVRQMGSANAQVIFMDLSRPTYIHDPDTGETILSFQILTNNGQKALKISDPQIPDLQTGMNKETPRSYAADVMGVGGALIDNTQITVNTNLAMQQQIDDPAKDFLNERFEIIGEVFASIPNEPSSCRVVPGTAFMPNMRTIWQLQDGFKPTDGVKPVMTVADWIIQSARRLHAQQEEPELGGSKLQLGGIGILRGPKP